MYYNYAFDLHFSDEVFDPDESNGVPIKTEVERKDNLNHFARMYKRSNLNHFARMY